jgi:hypothetical protein
MMEKEQLEEKIAETQSILDSLKAELGSSEEPAPEEDPSFSDMVESRMSPEEEESEAPMLEEAMEESTEEPDLDMESLYQIVYDETFDPSSGKSEAKLMAIKEALDKDPSMVEMAVKEPEKFALYMYGRNSTVR